MSAVAWHDVECGSYRADIGLWLELARSERGPILDVGAGTGRVALELARAAHEVVALDVDPELVAECARRAEGVLRTVVADAETFDLGEMFGLIVVPMQTVQLLGDRARFLARARRHLAPDGLLACALVDELEEFDGPLPPPDVAGRYVSQPTAVRVLERVVRLERLRDDGEAVSENVIELARVGAAEFEREGAAAGFVPEPALRIAPTADHVGSTVVMLRG